jgi:hypothetical protein
MLIYVLDLFDKGGGRRLKPPKPPLESATEALYANVIKQTLMQLFS